MWTWITSSSSSRNDEAIVTVEESLSSHKSEIEKENKTEECNEGTGTGTKRVAWAEIVKGTRTES